MRHHKLRLLRARANRLPRKRRGSRRIEARGNSSSPLDRTMVARPGQAAPALCDCPDADDLGRVGERIRRLLRLRVSGIDLAQSDLHAGLVERLVRLDDARRAKTSEVKVSAALLA